MVDRGTVNAEVAGSSPASTASKKLNFDDRNFARDMAMKFIPLLLGKIDMAKTDDDWAETISEDACNLSLAFLEACKEAGIYYEENGYG